MTDFKTIFARAKKSAPKLLKWIGLCAIAAFLLVGSYLLIQHYVLTPLNRYNRAVKLMDEKYYTDAIIIFDSLGDYKDSKAKSTECYTISSFRYAVNQLNNGSLKEGIEILKTLGDFRDSDKIVECLTGPDIVIPDVMTRIPDNAFAFRTDVTSVYVSSGVHKIGASAFHLCHNLKSLTFAENSTLTEIGHSAFYGCVGLESIDLPDSLSSIESGAFAACKKLKSIKIPDGIRRINGFGGCTGLTEVVFGDNSALSVIGAGAFFGCDNLTSITIPKTTTKIQDQAFSGCNSLTSISIPDSVTEINLKAFENCDQLEEVSFTENSNLSIIGEMAFADCENLTSFVIPDSVTDAGNSIFSNDNNLQTLTIPAQLIGKLYRLVNNQDSDFNTRFIKVSHLKFSNTVTKLSSYSFSEGYNEFTTVTIPVSVIEMERVVFFNCDKLTTIYYEGTVSQWEQIDKARNWYRGSAATEVICTDGTVTLGR